jgi:hypothetical protein
MTILWICASFKEAQDHDDKNERDERVAVALEERVDDRFVGQKPE